MTNPVSGLRRFRLERRPDSVPVALRELSDRLVTLRRAVRSAEWNTVLAASLDAVGAAHAHLPAIADLEADAAETLAFHADRAEAFSTAFAMLAERDDRVEVVAKLRAQLTAADPGLAQRLEVVLARIEAGERTFPSLATTAIDTMVPTGAPADLAIAAASRGLRGLAHHAFNAVSDPPPDLGTALQVLEEFDGLVTHRESLLRDAQTRLFDVIKAGSPRDVVAAEAQQLAATVEQFAAGFAAAQARVAAVASALRDAGRGTDAEKVGMRLAAAGLLCREAFASHAAAVALGVELRRFRPSPIAQRVLGIDEGMVFDAALPSGKRTELAHLSTVTDGTLVQIRGFATGFEQRRSADGKLLSQVTLLDPSSGSSATAVGVFIHLPHAGVTEGAYVVVHGFARTSSPLLAGGAGVEIDVLPLVELARRSWRLRLLELGALWAETWRNGLHIHWSLGPHGAADDDSPAATRGAAELVFTPFARDRS